MAYSSSFLISLSCGAGLAVCGGTYSWNDFANTLNALGHRLQALQVPADVFDGFFPGGTRGYVASGTFPATIASPAPTGFVVPQECAYVVAPVVGTVQTEWKIDCGAANNNARGVLGAALTRQGWTSCGSGLASAQWRKTDVMLTVSESSLAPGDYPRLSQSRVLSPC